MKIPWKLIGQIAVVTLTAYVVYTVGKGKEIFPNVRFSKTKGDAPVANDVPAKEAVASPPYWSYNYTGGSNVAFAPGSGGDSGSPMRLLSSNRVLEASLEDVAGVTAINVLTGMV